VAIMKTFACALLLTATWLRADIQTVTASATFADQTGETGGYAAAANLAPFDPSLGTLTSVDLTLSANYLETFFYNQDALNPTNYTPFFATISTTETGASTFFGTQSATQSLNIYVNYLNCLSPYCTDEAQLQFGGEQVFSGTDLAQFESGAPMPLLANAGVSFSASPGVLCCIPELDSLTAPNPIDPNLPAISVYGNLSLDVTAVYSYGPRDSGQLDATLDAPLDPVPEPKTWFALLLALSLMMAISRWRQRRLTRAAALPPDRSR
jgi:hypothetical protein